MPSTMFDLNPIGYMKSVFHFKNGTPRQSSLCENARGILTIDKSVFNNPEHSLDGLQDFSHAWILFIFHKNNNAHKKAKVKPPRLNGQRVGVFSTRSPYRPNNIGLSLAKIDKIQGSWCFSGNSSKQDLNLTWFTNIRDAHNTWMWINGCEPYTSNIITFMFEKLKGASIHFSGIDILDGTPVIDVKPYIPEYDKPMTEIDSCALEPSTNRSEISNISTKVLHDPDIPVECPSQNLACSQKEPQEDYMPEMNNKTDSVVSSCDNQMRELCGSTSLTLPSDSIEEGFYSLSAALDKAREKLTQCSERCDSENDQDANTVSNSEAFPSIIGSNFQTYSDRENPESSEDDILNSLVGEVICRAASDVLLIANTVKEEVCRSRSKSPKDNLSISLSTQGTATARETTHNRLSATDISTVTAPWISSPPVSKVNVSFSLDALHQIKAFHSGANDARFKTEMLSGPEDAKKAITSILHEEPRSVYRRQKCQNSVYFFAVDVLHVTCWFDGDTVTVLRIKPVADVPQLQEKKSPKDGVFEKDDKRLQ